MATPSPPVLTLNTILASSFYQIKPLGQDNWLAWKHRTQAVLQEHKLIGHIEATISESARTNPGYHVWKEEDDEKAQTQLELSMEDKELDNLTGDNAAELWANLSTVKQSKGKMGILRTQRTLYRKLQTFGPYCLIKVLHSGIVRLLPSPSYRYTYTSTKEGEGEREDREEVREML